MPMKTDKFIFVGKINEPHMLNEFKLYIHVVLMEILLQNCIKIDSERKNNNLALLTKAIETCATART